MTTPGQERAPAKVWLAAAALLAAFASLAIASARGKSATWDETRYVGLGKYLVQEGRFDLPSITTTPPLTFYLNSILLPFATLDASCFRKGPAASILDGVSRGQCLYRTSDPRGDDLLFLSRLPFIGVGLGLGLLVFLWSRRLFGTGGGFLSLLLYVTCPNILASTRLITQDITLSALGFVTIILCWRWRARGWSWREALLVGVSLGLTLATKYPGLLWAPMVLGLWGTRFLSPPERPGDGSLGRRRAWSQLAAVVAIAVFVLALSYRFQVREYLNGYTVQSFAVGEAFPAFLNGEVSHAGGWWSYYAYAIAIKTPLPALALYLLGMAAVLTRRSEDRLLPLFLLGPALTIVVAFSCYRTVNVGLRYVLPAYPFLMVMAGGAVRCVGRKGAAVLALLGAWCAVETATIHPHYLAYFNQTVGGPSEGFRHLLDSNLGWGGELRELAGFARERRLPMVKLSYHGTALPELYDFKYEALPSFVLPGALAGPVHLSEGDWVAVSAENLEPLFLDLGDLRRFLKTQKPDAVIGYSIFIYHLTNLQQRLQAFGARGRDAPTDSRPRP